jgi:hypothetical protein
MRLVLLVSALVLQCGCSGQTPKPAPHSVNLNWQPSPSKGVHYYLYRAAGECGTPQQVFEKLTPDPIDALTYSDTTVRSGRKYCYRVTSTDGKSESPPSQQINAVIP